MSRFPSYLWARLSLLGRVLVHVPVGVMTPMGGSITSRAEVSIPYFDKYMFFAGIANPKQQRRIFDDLLEMQAQMERYKEGDGVFIQGEHAEEVIRLSDQLRNPRRAEETTD